MTSRIDERELKDLRNDVEACADTLRAAQALLDQGLFADAVRLAEAAIQRYAITVLRVSIMPKWFRDGFQYLLRIGSAVRTFRESGARGATSASAADARHKVVVAQAFHDQLYEKLVARGLIAASQSG